MRAPYNLGRIFFPPTFKSDGSKSSTNNNLIQSSASEVEGFFFNPGTSLISKNFSSAEFNNFL